MSGGGGGGGGGGSRAGGGGATGPIPLGSRRMVHSLKEIVNCPEAEIYAMLRECNMDPSETVHRLLSQDTFHEVKSKREKKKETKETPEPRSRAVNSISNRGVRGGTDRGGRISSIQYSTSDDGVSRGKPEAKKENGVTALPTSSILGPGVNNLNRRSPVLNGSILMDNMTQATVAHDGASLPSQPSAVSQHNWLGGPGHVTMADIVKRGRPQGKPSSASITAGDTAYTPHSAVISNVPHHSAGSSATHQPSESNHDSHSFQDLVTRVSEINHEMGIDADQHISHDDWSLVEESPAGSASTVVEAPAASSVHDEPSESSALLVDGVNMHVNHHLDDIHILEGNADSENLVMEPIRPASSSDRQANMDNSGDNSSLVDDSLNKINSFQSQRHEFEHHEVEDVNVEISTAAASMQQLSLHKEDLDAPSMGDRPAVIIPNHLQVTNADCSHLSFGSFGSGVSATFSGPFPSKPLKTNLEMASVSDDTALVDQQETRNSEYYDNGQLRPTASENVDSRTGASTRNYDTPSASQPEVIRNDTLDSTHGLQFNIPSVSGYSLPSTTQTNVAAYSYPQTNSQMQNLAPFSSLLQPYNSPLSNNPLTSTLPPVRNFDIPFLPFLTTQSMPTKYSTSASSISGPTISMAEVMKPGVLSSQTSQQTLPSTTIPTGPALPQHLPVHPYSQPTLPLGPFYPYVPHSYTYVPSAAFQQTYTGNGAMHQSPASLHSAGMKYNLPQYKSSVSATSLPQSAAVATGYGGFGNSTTIPGSYALNPNPTPSASSTIEEALNSQYKEASHYVLQQSENPAMWAHGAGSRTMSTLPASTFYSFLGQNQHGGFRQGQQPSPLGNLGYPNIYHSQAGASQEHQQSPGEANLNGSQGAQSHQSHQIWQHSY